MPRLILFRVLSKSLNVLVNIEELDFLAFEDYFSSLTHESLIELLYGLYPSGNTTSKVIILQIALVYLDGKVSYAILNFFNLIQEVCFHLVLDVIDKNSGISEILQKKSVNSTYVIEAITLPQ